MGLCADPPDPPDMTAMAEASRYQADMARQYQRETMQWNREQWDRTEALMRDTLGVQTSIMHEQWEAGKKDRKRYEEIYQPLEEELVKEFREYGTPERIALEQGRAQASVQQAYDAQRENSQRRLESYGIDPSQTRSGAMDTGARVQMAAQQAAAGNQARYQVENVGRALRSEALNIGKGYPGNVAQSYGQAINAGNAASDVNARGIGTNTAGQQVAQGWGGQALSGYNQSANITNMGYQNQLAAFNSQGNPWEVGAQLVGGAAGVASGFEEGGEVPQDGAAPGPTDKVPALLAEGEYIVPADVVMKKGTDFFDKMTEKAREGIPA